MKTVDSLTVEDLSAHPVWQYVSNDESDELSVRPVKRLPVSKLTGKLVGLEVALANGGKVWAVLGNVDADNPRLTQHMLTLSVERDGRWFHAARYHDFDHEQRGPVQLAAFLGLEVEAVFPIAYDLRPYAKGDPRALSGSIEREPAERLTRGEIIAMAVP